MPGGRTNLKRNHHHHHLRKCRYCAISTLQYMVGENSHSRTASRRERRRRWQPAGVNTYNRAFPAGTRSTVVYSFLDLCTYLHSILGVTPVLEYVLYQDLVTNHLFALDVGFSTKSTWGERRERGARNLSIKIRAEKKFGHDRYRYSYLVRW